MKTPIKVARNIVLFHIKYYSISLRIHTQRLANYFTIIIQIYMHVKQHTHINYYITLSQHS